MGAYRLPFDPRTPRLPDRQHGTMWREIGISGTA
jgi:hypothetical protein